MNAFGESSQVMMMKTENQGGGLRKRRSMESHDDVQDDKDRLHQKQHPMDHDLNSTFITTTPTTPATTKVTSTTGNTTTATTSPPLPAPKRKILIHPLTSERTRQVTFSKRKLGLFKKAYELSVLCSTSVAVMIVSPNGKVFEYASEDMEVLRGKCREGWRKGRAERKGNGEMRRIVLRGKGLWREEEVEEEEEAVVGEVVEGEEGEADEGEGEERRRRKKRRFKRPRVELDEEQEEQGLLEEGTRDGPLSSLSSVPPLPMPPVMTLSDMLGTTSPTAFPPPSLHSLPLPPLPATTPDTPHTTTPYQSRVTTPIISTCSPFMSHASPSLLSYPHQHQQQQKSYGRRVGTFSHVTDTLPAQPRHYDYHRQHQPHHHGRQGGVHPGHQQQPSRTTNPTNTPVSLSTPLLLSSPRTPPIFDPLSLPIITPTPSSTTTSSTSLFPIASPLIPTPIPPPSSYHPLHAHLPTPPVEAQAPAYTPTTSTNTQDPDAFAEPWQVFIESMKCISPSVLVQGPSVQEDHVPRLT